MHARAAAVQTLQANYLRAVRLSDISINMVSTFTVRGAWQPPTLPCPC